MIQFLALPVLKLLGSMVGSVGSLAVGATKMAAGGVSAIAGIGGGGSDDEKEKVNAVLENVKGTTPKNKEKVESGDEEGGEEVEDKKEMFGGLELNKIKSAIDDVGEIGPNLPVKGGVYKQIVEVNKSMLQSLLRMENTMRMLLAIEFERIQGMQQQAAVDNLEEGDTDDLTTQKKQGLLGRAASGLGGMLSGAYGKAKGGGLGTALALAAGVAAFKLFPEQIKAAFAKLAEFFTNTYEYFTAEDFSLEKMFDDITTKLLPNVTNFILKTLDWIWTTLKNVATEWLFGASGEKRIAQETTTAQVAGEQISSVVGQTDSAGEIITMDDVDDSNNFNKRYMGDMTKAQRKKSSKGYQDRLKSMLEIAQQGEGRIQWSGIEGDMSGLIGKYLTHDHGGGFFKGILPSTILKSNPIVDGVQFDSWDVLQNLTPGKLNEMAGITESMSDDEKADITKVLVEKTRLAQTISFRENDPEFASRNEFRVEAFGLNIPGSPLNAYNNSVDRGRLEDDKLRLLELEGMNIGQDFMKNPDGYTEGTLGEFQTLDGSNGTTALKESEKQTKEIEYATDNNKPPGIVLAPSTSVINQGDVVNANTTNQIAMSGVPSSPAVKALAYDLNMRSTGLLTS